MRSASDHSRELSPQAERALFLRGVDLFNAGAFFEAHEAWEDVWRCSRDVKREFYQGLVQCAVALEHFRRGNARGAMRLHDRYQRHFSQVPDRFMGLDMARLLAGMEHALKPALDRQTPPERGELVLDHSRAPRIGVEPAAAGGDRC
jgi:hypothetical protein